MLPVLNASVRFYTSSAIVPCYDEEGALQQHVTAPLHCVASPEEKRKIIGDTFIKVANEAIMELNLQASQIFLAQGVKRRCCFRQALTFFFFFQAPFAPT